jgi:hypothetical protein
VVLLFQAIYTRDAIAEYKTVLALNRNQVQTISDLAICKILTGAEDEAIPLIERAIRLSLLSPCLADNDGQRAKMVLEPSTRHMTRDLE